MVDGCALVAYNARINGMNCTWEARVVTKGRLPGLYLTGRQLLVMAMREYSFYWVVGDSGLCSVWQGDRPIDVVRSEAAARRLVIREVSEMLVRMAGGE